MPNILDKIVSTKKHEVRKAKTDTPLDHIIDNLPIAEKTRRFVDAIEEKIENNEIALIAEIKKASPSKGLIREDFNPNEIAVDYYKAGACCLSVLTDEQYFMGHADYLKTVKKACKLPILRKDFIIDEYQIYESRFMGADCILLIMAILSDNQASEFVTIANDIGLDILVEVHDEAELERALKLDVRLIGINNRNLKTFETRIEVSEELSKLIYNDDMIIVSESGIFLYEDIKRLQKCGINCFLVGESLMRQDDIYKATRQLLSGEI